MPYYEFGPNDLFYNRIKTYPDVEFFIYSGSIYYNNKLFETGSFSNVVMHMTGGDIAPGMPGISLYEMNIDRPTGSMVYAHLVKGSSRTSFKTITTGDFADISQFNWADTIEFPYPLTASIDREYFVATYPTRSHIKALKSTLNYYTKNSVHYAYSSSNEHPHARDFDDCHINLISIPSIFYGSSIKKGTVDLKFYITGTLIGRLQDENKNGELIQTEPSDSLGTASVAGVVLYREGFILLTGSYALSTYASENYRPGETKDLPKWIYFAATGSKTVDAANHTKLPSSSFDMRFSGVNYVSTMTMLAHAPRAELNYTANPTYIEYSYKDDLPTTGSTFYKDPEVQVKNIVSSSYPDPTASFLKQTYISKIGLYDEKRNLIGIAKLANPVRKREVDDYTFKLKLDI